jgi:hypothetical protein
LARLTLGAPGRRPFCEDFEIVAVTSATYRADEARGSRGEIAAAATAGLRRLPGLLLLRRP